MEKVNISDYEYKSFSPSIIVNLSNKPFWFNAYGGSFYSHNFDRFNLNSDGYLEIRDDYYKQLNLNNIISESSGSDDYRALNPKCIAFALHSEFSWSPYEEQNQQNISGASALKIYSGTEVNLNQPEVYLDTDNRKIFVTSYFNSLADITKLEVMRNFLPFFTYVNNNVALNLSYKLQASGKSGIKSGQFIL